MISLRINDISVSVEEGTTLLEACRLIGIDIPHLCHHPLLKPSGHCRMCVVEEEGKTALLPSCATPVADNMVIFTETPKIAKARAAVMRGLLKQHPLDCPLCDQGGDCALQEYSWTYGDDKSGPSAPPKKVQTEKNFGAFIETHMNRCITCQRCTRFSQEMTGFDEVYLDGKGSKAEVKTRIKSHFKTRLSGSLIDLCPVGALNASVGANRYRPWEITQTASVDVSDGVCAPIYIDSLKDEIARVRPRHAHSFESLLISDKARFSYDGLSVNRLDRPYVRNENGGLKGASWHEAFQTIAERIVNVPGNRFAALAGDLADCESMLLLKELMKTLGSSHYDCRQDGGAFVPGERASYRFNTGFEGIEKADLILLIGTHPRDEAAIVNTHIRKRHAAGGLEVFSVGNAGENGYPVTLIGEKPAALRTLLDGRTTFAGRLKKAKFPMLIVGAGALSRPDGDAILGMAAEIAERSGMVRDDWNGFNVLQQAASRVGGLDLGFYPTANGMDTGGILAAARKGEINILYLLGADEILPEEVGNAFVIYQGHHASPIAQRADVILPGCAYTEKSATYLATDGRLAQTEAAVPPLGDSHEDWRIIRGLSAVLGYSLPFDNLETVRRRMRHYSDSFAPDKLPQKAAWTSFAKTGRISNALFTPAVPDFFLSNVICRHSEAMRAASKLEKKA